MAQLRRDNDVIVSILGVFDRAVRRFCDLSELAIEVKLILDSDALFVQAGHADQVVVELH